MPLLRIYLFGVPRFEWDAKPVHIPRRKAVALLAYLAATGQTHSRDALATMFWSEYDQSKARANLRRELSRIKAVLGEETLEIQREKVGLREPDRWWLDVKAFQDDLNAAQELLLKQSDTTGEQDISKLISEIRDAVAQYSGEFMAGFSLPDSPQFDEWQFFQRDTLNRSLSNALQRLIYWETARGAYEEAIQYARRLLTIDNLYESTHRQLMQLYTWSGQQGAAIRQYEQIVHLLEKEIGVEPEEETLALYEAIKSRQLAPPDNEALRLVAPWITYGQQPDQRAISPAEQPAQEIQPVDLKQHSSSINLPVQSTPFIGREVEQIQLYKRLVEDPYS